MLKKAINVNEVPRTMVVDPEASLADVIRGQLGLTGTKVGCGTAHCGSCSVIMDGKVVRSCATKMKNVEDGANITTIEGIGTPIISTLSRWHGWFMVERNAVFAARFHRIGQSAFGPERKSQPRGCPRLVSETSQCMPLHRLQAAGGCSHGCGPGGARRNEKRGARLIFLRTARSGVGKCRVRVHWPRSQGLATTARISG